MRRFEPLGNWSQNNVRGVLGQQNFKREKDRDRKRERERKKQKKREKRKKKEREKESCFFRILAWTRTRTRSRAMSRPATAAGAGAAGPVTQATNSWPRRRITYPMLFGAHFQLLNVVSGKSYYVILNRSIAVTLAVTQFLFVW